MTPVRVLRVITRLNIGGPARQALLLTRALRQDFPTTLVAGTPPPHEGELTDPVVSVVRAPLVRRPNPVLDLRALRLIRRRMDAEGVRILHTHMAKAGALGRLAVGRRPIARVHTFHGHVLEGYFPRAVERTFVVAERALAKRTDVLVAVSQEVRQSLLGLGIGRDDQIRVIPLGLDLRQHLQVTGPSGALRRHLGLGDELPLVGCVGRLVHIKDHQTLLQAFKRLPDVHLAILGDGPLQLELRATAERLGLASRTHFVGWWHDMPSAISDMDLVILTSVNEGTPVALIEAHACGTAVVSTSVGGVPSVVLHGRTGLLVPPGDPVAVSDAVSTLLGDDDLRRRMGANGRAHVHERFTHERLVHDIRDLYRSLA